eukprot:GILK01013868.1.p1 GENE.GILK01013868.1~~GILK01013868.1.p1  ORF type:complete len:188 (-),score=31.33 GILK01013868.1:52-615(-)
MKRSSNGLSQSATLFKLAQVNGIAAFASAQVFQTGPLFVHPSSARAFFGIKRTAEEDMKQLVFNALAPKLPQQQWVYKRTGTFSDTNFDITDALLIAMYGRVQYFLNTWQADTDLYNSFCEHQGVDLSSLNKPALKDFHVNSRVKFSKHLEKVLRSLILVNSNASVNDSTQEKAVPDTSAIDQRTTA